MFSSLFSMPYSVTPNPGKQAFLNIEKLGVYYQI